MLALPADTVENFCEAAVSADMRGKVHLAWWGRRRMGRMGHWVVRVKVERATKGVREMKAEEVMVGVVEGKE